VIAALLLVAASFSGPTGPAPNFSAVDKAVRHGIQRGVYPGAVVVIGTHDRILHSAHFGHYTWNPTSPRPRADSTLWDLASLTKVIAAGAALRMVDQGVLDLDAPVAQYVPEFSGGERDSVTVKMLLLHTSGLPPFLPLYRTATSRAEAMAQVTSASLVQRPGKSAIYSDLNGILLGLVLESAAGMPLDSVLMQQVFSPLGMQETMFRPPHSLLARIAPSSFLKGQVVAGVPNDQNAQTLGGISGHAGLFATASDLARFAQTWLRDGMVDDSTAWVKASTVKEFLTGSDFSGSRLLGWDTPDPTYEGTSVFGSMLSSAAYGHTGWTGTEMWVDPARDVFVVFLANRSFDSRARHSLRAMAEVRAAVSDAVARAVPARDAGLATRDS
jgi:CubicO group peptidase (beta-lactamase class C family)